MDKAHGYADKTIEEIEKELKEIYATAQKELAKKAEAYMNKFIAEDERQRKLLDTGKLTEKEYQQWLKKKVMSGQRFTKMKEQCAEQLTHANEIALGHINDRMADVYAVSYNALEKDVKGLSGYSFHIVSPDTVKTLAGKDSSLLPYKKLDPAKDIPWNMKAINSEVLQGVLQGESVKAITKRVFGYTTKTGKDQAEIAHKMQVAAARTAQTLITAAENKGRMDSYDRAAKDGVIIEKEWIATNDHATRDSHRDLDGTSVSEDKPFDNGLMFPGDWSGPPEEVYNCRCSMAAVVKGFTSSRDIKDIVFVKGENDPEITDSIEDMNLPENVRKNLDKIENIKTYEDLETYLAREGISLDTDIDKLKAEMKAERIPVIEDTAQKIVVSIETYKEIFGNDALSALNRIKIYDNDLHTTAAFFYNKVGENDPLAGTLSIRKSSVSGRVIFHEMGHAYQASHTREGEDAVTFADRIRREYGKDFGSHYGKGGEAENAEMMTDTIAWGLVDGKKEYIDFIEWLRRHQR